MSYKLPSVSVSQILLRASQNLADSDLLPCFVGPLYQSAVDIALSGNLIFPVVSTTIIYPNLKIGAIVDNTSIKIKTYNTVVQVGIGVVSGSLTAGSNTITATTTAPFLAAKAGDMVYLTGNGIYTIASVASGNLSVTTVETINSPYTGATITTKRNVGTVYCTPTSPTYGLTSITIAGLTYSSFVVQSADSTAISYVALRKDLTGFYTLTNLDQLAIDMDINILNPLGYYLGIIAPGANGGKKVLAYITSDAADATYIASLSNLSIRRDAYFLVPLSQSTAVKNAFAANAIAMSDPSVSYFRTAILNATLTTQKTYTLGTSTYTK